MRAFVVVDMGVGADGDQRIGVLRHQRGDVGVQIERHGDGRVGAERDAKTAEQLAFSVLEGFGHHGTVEMQQGAVAAFGLGQDGGC